MVFLCLLHLSLSDFACLLINNARTREVLEKGMFEIRRKIEMNKISQCPAPKACSAIVVLVPVPFIHCFPRLICKSCYWICPVSSYCSWILVIYERMIRGWEEKSYADVCGRRIHWHILLFIRDGPASEMCFLRERLYFLESPPSTSGFCPVRQSPCTMFEKWCVGQSIFWFLEDYHSARVECLLARNPVLRLVLGCLPVGWLLVLQLPLDLFIGMWPELLIPQGLIWSL